MNGPNLCLPCPPHTRRPLTPSAFDGLKPALRGHVEGKGADSLPAVSDKASPSTLRLWVLSDLSVDGCAFGLPKAMPEFDALVLAGDISDCLERSIRWLATELDGRQGSRPVILVPGNREFWNGRPKAETLRRGRALAVALGITLLSDEVIRLDDGQGAGVHVIGATLWTDWALNGTYKATIARGYARHRLPDCRNIRLGPDTRYLPHDAAGAHARSRAFIEDALGCIKVQAGGYGISPVALVRNAVPGDRAVVVSHHAPSRRSLPADMSELYDEWVPTRYASNLDEVLHSWEAPKLWVHGHVPRPVDIRIGKTRVVANPRGPVGADTAFDPVLIVEA